MSKRTTAEIVADMRRPGSVVEWWMKDVRTEAADRLVELAGYVIDLKTQLARAEDYIEDLKTECQIARAS